MDNKITIDIGILQGIFGDLNKVQASLGGVSSAVAAMDKAVSQAGANAGNAFSGMQEQMSGLGGGDVGGNAIMNNLLGPIAKTDELRHKLDELMDRKGKATTLAEITSLDKEIKDVQHDLNAVSGEKMESSVGGAFSRIKSLMGELVAPIAALFAVDKVFEFGGAMVEAAGKTEDYRTRLTMLLGSGQKANAMFEDMEKLIGGKNNFGQDETRDASTRLLQMGFSAKSVVPNLKLLEDVAAGSGQSLGEIAALFGRVKEKGLDTRVLTEMVRGGIPIYSSLAKTLGVGTEQMEKLVNEGKVGLPELQRAFGMMTSVGGPFDGAAEKMQGTLAGRIGQMKKDWSLFTEHLGEKLKPAIMGVLDLVSSLASGFMSAVRWMREHATVMEIVAGVLGLYTLALIANNAASMYNSVLQGIAAVRAGAMAIATTFSTGAMNIATAATWAWNAAMDANPIGIVILAIAGLVASLVWCWKHLETFRGICYGTWAVFKDTFVGMWNIAKTVFDSIIDTVMGAVHTIKGAIRSIWSDEGTKEMNAGIAQGIKGATEGMALPGMLKDMFKTSAKDAVTGFYQGKKDVQDELAADKKKEADAKAGKILDPANAYTAGSKMGLSSDMVGGATGGAGGRSGDSGGVSVGGKGGGDRNISMNITMNMRFDVARHVEQDIKKISEMVVGSITNKLRDAEFALG